jgi:glycosyltransferase involved in cell wall biosynthesis
VDRRRASSHVDSAAHQDLTDIGLRSAGRFVRRRLALETDAARARNRRIDLAVFHDFAPSPAGGANQSLRALLNECERRGVVVGINTLARDTRACLFNSFNFEVDRLRLFARRADGVRLVHRVGAVTSLYRGVDDGTDAFVAAVNREFADSTIAISQATIDMYRTIGIELVAPRVVYNPCDPTIFHPRGRTHFRRDRKTRIVAASWSSNAKKGGPVYQWLESNLDWSRFELTFVGNAASDFARLRHLPPVPSPELAELFRTHDIFLTATENDAYSNALVEALSCGLPAVYLESGGSGEAVKQAGFGFLEREEIPELLNRLVDEYEERQAMISLPSLAEVVDDYLEVLGLGDFVASTG